MLDEGWSARLARYPQAVLQQLRVLVLAGGAALLLAFYSALSTVQIIALSCGFTCMAVWGALLNWQEQRGRSLSLGWQLGVDALLLAALLAAVGGATNPAISYLLVPAALGGLLLTPKSCAKLTLWLLVLYSVLIFWHWPLHSLAPVAQQHANHEFHLSAHLNPHVLGMWLTFSVSAVAIAWLLSMQVELGRQARMELQRLREQQLRDENVLAVATLAAGAAHELATPLATLAVGLEEMQVNAAEGQVDVDELALMQAQVERCRQTLQQLAHTARQHQAGERELATVPDFIEQLCQQWQVLLPQSQLHQCAEVAGPLLLALWPLTLKQALLNLLNNAARESEQLELHYRWDEATLTLQVRDFGTGISDERLLNTHQLQASKQGLGMGLLLTHASIEQAGGSLRLLRADSGGTVALIQLPIHWQNADAMVKSERGAS